MGYVYNDAEMMLGTQLAYFDFKRGDKVGEVIDDYLSTYTRVENGTRVLKEQYVGNSSIEKQFEVAKNIESLGQNSAVSQNWKNWTIKDVCNDQNGTGYWGTLIDIGDGNAMIANRGSESYDLEQLFKDWIVADIGLLIMHSRHSRREQRFICRNYGKNMVINMILSVLRDIL